MSRGFSDCCHYDDGYDEGYDDGRASIETEVGDVPAFLRFYAQTTLDRRDIAAGDQLRSFADAIADDADIRGIWEKKCEREAKRVTA